MGIIGGKIGGKANGAEKKPVVVKDEEFPRPDDRALPEEKAAHVIGGKKQEDDYVIVGRPSSRQALNLRDLPDLFEKIRQMSQSLMKLEAELCMKLQGGQEVWLVHEYGDSSRHEMTFEDATQITIMAAAFGGKVIDVKFPTAEDPIKEEDAAVSKECEEPEEGGEGC